MSTNYLLNNIILQRGIIFLHEILVFVDQHLVDIWSEFGVVVGEVDLCFTATFKRVDFSDSQWVAEGQSTNVCESEILGTAWDEMLVFELVKDVPGVRLVELEIVLLGSAQDLEKNQS